MRPIITLAALGAALAAVAASSAGAITNSASPPASAPAPIAARAAKSADTTPLGRPEAEERTQGDMPCVAARPSWWSLSDEVAAGLPAGYAMRPLEAGDYALGFLETLAALTAVGDVSQAAFEKRLAYMAARPDEYMPVVVEAAGRVVAAGTLVLEAKFIHGCALLGHIEDVVVHGAHQGRGLGRLVVRQLQHLAAAAGAYKATLDCDDKNEAFYTKTGMHRRGLQMAVYFPENE